jgi:hypothetical protein
MEHTSFESLFRYFRPVNDLLRCIALNCWLQLDIDSQTSFRTSHNNGGI